MKKLLAKSTIAALLLSQAGLGTSVFAAENDQAGPSDSTNHAEEPSLVKGDFFYFVKTTVENIQLLVTTDKVKEAKLLTQFAQERIAEASKLMQEGKEDLAKQSLQEALKEMKEAQDKVGTGSQDNTTTTQPIDQTGSQETTTNVQTKDDTSTKQGTVSENDGQSVTGGNNTDQSTTTTPSDTNENSNNQTGTKANDDNSKKEEDKSEEQDGHQHKSKEEKEIEEIQLHISNNLLALANVLDKVKNPTAKAAITKNIEKSFGKLADQLDKLEKSQAEKENQPKVTEPIVIVQYPSQDPVVNTPTDTNQNNTTINTKRNDATNDSTNDSTKSKISTEEPKDDQEKENKAVDRDQRTKPNKAVKHTEKVKHENKQKEEKTKKDHKDRQDYDKPDHEKEHMKKENKEQDHKQHKDTKEHENHGQNEKHHGHKDDNKDRHENKNDQGENDNE